MGPNTERMYREAIAEAGLLDGPLDELPPLDALRAAVLAKRPMPALPKHQTTSLEPYVALITTLVEKRLGPRAIFSIRASRGRSAGCLWIGPRVFRRDASNSVRRGRL